MSSTYSEMSTLYRDPDGRGRYEMCIREQAFIYSDSSSADIAALGQAIVGGSGSDIDSVIAGIVTGPNSAELADDGALLAAVQSVWPTVAAARYPAAG